MTFSLEIVEGAGAGTALPLIGTLIIGRGPAADVILSDGRISPRHAVVTVTSGSAEDSASGQATPGSDERAGSRVIVEDLNSGNGTFVNGQAVRQPTWLAPGDELLVGATVLTVSGGDPLAGERLSAEQDGDGAYRLPRARRRSAELDQPQSARLGACELHRLFDASVKRRAQTAPPVLLAVVCLIVAVYLMGR
jgi:pSer/pThr/pTyr-binding forkhead associated (FHA) protein